jgi:hypothetical protein
MSGISEGQTGSTHEGGISALDLADLPAVQRKIMRLMLREVQATDAALRQMMDAQPEDERLSSADFDQGLAWLSEHHWLIREVVEQEARYKVNFRRKAGRASPESGRRRGPGAAIKAIWEALEGDHSSGEAAERGGGS